MNFWLFLLLILSPQINYFLYLSKFSKLFSLSSLNLLPPPFWVPLSDRFIITFHFTHSDLFRQNHPIFLKFIGFASFFSTLSASFETLLLQSPGHVSILIHPFHTSQIYFFSNLLEKNCHLLRFYYSIPQDVQASFS